ncbi:MAG: ImmA/IrrE family metallo-endopeptidase, partial [Fulvivirga sp.]
DNYFKELEDAAEAFRESCGVNQDQTIDFNQLENLLKSQFDITVDRDSLSTIAPLRDLRSYYVKSNKKLLLNEGLTEAQQSFLLGRELAFQYLKIKKRPEETPPQKVYGFDAILNNYKASYFSAALIMPESQVVADIRSVAALPKLNNQMLIDLIDKYGATPELLMQRLTNILPQHFGIKNLFFLRFVGTDNFSKYDLTKELHLSRAHSPHANGLNEHYCRRWLAIRMIKQLRATSRMGDANEIITGAQISKYYGTEDDYFCLSLAFPNISNPIESISVTIGFYIESNLKKRIKFIDDPDIKSRIVNNTCERCAWAECEDRIAPPEFIEKVRQQEDIIKAMEGLG